LPVEDRLQLGEWSDTMMSAEGAEDDTDPRLQRAATAWAAYVTYLVELLEDRRAHPKDDLISILLQSADAGALQFHEDELQSKLAEGGLPMSDLSGDELFPPREIHFAGNETTRNALPRYRRAVTLSRRAAEARRRPVARQHRDRGDPALRVSRDQLSRTATAETELRGRTIHAGDAPQPLPVGEP
jgi:hypothetical protein